MNLFMWLVCVLSFSIAINSDEKIFSFYWWIVVIVFNIAVGYLYVY